MFAWISGSGEHSNQATSLAINGDTITEAPQTPAPVFAMRAFKQVLFGTPQPSTTAEVPLLKSLPPIQDLPALDTVQPTRLPKDGALSTSPISKQRHILQPSEAQKQNELASNRPQGILMTPGTINGPRKQVKFGQQVVDNEGKNNKYSKSGLPNDFPGKFPSPWTPKTTSPARPRIGAAAAGSQAVTNAVVENNVESRFREILDVTRPASPANVTLASAAELLVKPPRSKDDGDVTMDLALPRSAAGRYWKNQYEQFSTNSVVETKRIIAKHKLAKDYARMKDAEAQELRTQLEYEREKRAGREASLERQVKDLRGRLREMLAKNAKLCAEITSMRMQSDKQQAQPGLPMVNVSHTEPDIVRSDTPIKCNPGPIETSEADACLGDIWLDTNKNEASGTRSRKFGRVVKTEQLARRSRNPAPIASNREHTGSPIRRQIRREPIPRPHLSPLSDRSINLPTSTPTTTKWRADVDVIDLDVMNDKAVVSKGQVVLPSINHDSILQLDYSVPLEALSLQASQAVTPPADDKIKPKSGRNVESLNSENTYSSPEKARLAEARLRVAERRKAKREKQTKSQN